MMVYENRFALSVLVNGKVLPEMNDGTVEMPFNSEYVLRFRNKHKDRRAVVHLFIDGEQQHKGGYVIPANGYLDLEHNSYTTRRFKFVSPESIESQICGKDTNNQERLNGVLEARFFLEKEVKQNFVFERDETSDRPWQKRERRIQPGVGVYPGMTFLGATIPTNTSGPTLSTANYCEALPMPANPTKDAIAGVTVQGSESSQRLRKVNIDTEDHYSTLKLFLKGYFAEHGSAQLINAAYCPNCGTTRASKSANFCHICGHKY